MVMDIDSIEESIDAMTFLKNKFLHNGMGRKQLPN